MAPGDMASAKRTPKVSKISRDRSLAYVRKQKPTTEATGVDRVEPWPDATPLSMNPAGSGRVCVAPTGIDRFRSAVAMPAQASFGEPPVMLEGAAAVPAGVDVGLAEDPTVMPGPREIPPGNPDDPAPPPGYVPPGDSRSMRRRTDHDEFALIYRIQTYVIRRFGKVGSRGQWQVVEYPTSASASHAYAKECSRFVSEGFSDYRA